MSFLQPFLLVALAAAAIPILLHLLTLRRLKVIPFSTLTFLKELQTSRVRAVRLRQLILLLLRTLLVLLIVLAFARPAFKGSFIPGLGTETKTDALIILDDSYSMTMRNTDGSLLRQATAAARSIIDGLNPDDRVMLLPLSDAGTASPVTRVWLSPADAAGELGSVTASPRTVGLGTALNAVPAILAPRTAAHREVFIISDLQHGLLSSAPTPHNRIEHATRVSFVQVGPGTDENMSIRSAPLTSAIVESGSPVTFAVTVRNDRSAAPRTANVSLFLDGERVDQRVQTLAPGETQQVELRGAPRTNGFLTGSIVLTGDQADFDNVSSFVLHIPVERKVLLVGTQEEVFHASLALSTSGAEGRSGFRLTTVSADRLTARMMQDNTVLVLFDPVLREDLQRALEDQVRAGTGIILVPSTTPGRSGRTASDVLRCSFAVTPTSVRQGSFLAFGRVDDRHPLFEGMFDQLRTDRTTARRIESPDVYTYATHRRGPSSRTIISLSNGESFLTETELGAGRILSFTVAFTPAWSSFPLSGLFAPLIHRSIVFVSGDNAYRPPSVPGEELLVQLPPGATRDLRLRFPDGDEIPVQPTILPGGPALRTTDATAPGLYSVLSGTDEVDRFAVNISPNESDVAPAEQADLDALAERHGIPPESLAFYQQDDGLGERVYTARVGTELWATLLVLALIVALLESWLSSTLRAPSSEDRPA